MAGFFGLFGKKKDEPKDAYFLSPDESKSYGDIDFMRTSKTVRRTFVKTVSNPEGGEVISTVSSEKAVSRDGKEAKRIAPKSASNGGFTSSFGNTSFTPSTPAPAPTPAPTPAPEPVAESKPEPAPAPAPAPEPQPDNSMDMFRNMAKQIKR